MLFRLTKETQMLNGGEEEISSVIYLLEESKEIAEDNKKEITKIIDRLKDVKIELGNLIKRNIYEIKKMM